MDWMWEQYVLYNSKGDLSDNNEAIAVTSVLSGTINCIRYI